MSNSCDCIEVGQVWERDADGARIEITHVAHLWADTNYRRLDNKRLGAIYAHNLRRLYTLVEGATP